MKTKINLLSFLLLIVFSVSMFISCSNDETGDTTSPAINLIAPTEGAILKIGSDVHFDLELSDNEMLASYKVEIHNNFDGHQHNRSMSAHGSAVNEDGTEPFFFQKVWDVSGQKNTKIHHHEIIISENATPGAYHLMIYCTDAAGNESYVARNIMLSHDGEVHEH